MSSEKESASSKDVAAAGKAQGSQPTKVIPFQPTPIIITGGSLTISSPLAEFQDANGNPIGRIVKINLPGRITGLSFDDGNGPEGPDVFSSANPAISIIYMVQKTTP